MFIVKFYQEKIRKNAVVSEWMESIEVEWNASAASEMRSHWITVSLKWAYLL